MKPRFLNVWMAFRYLGGTANFLGLTGGLSVFGIGLGVACLVLGMAVVSGYETTLKNAVIDVVGHVLLVKRGSRVDNPDRLVERVREITPDLVAYTPFLHLEAVLAHNKRLSGVVIEGVDRQTVDSVLNIRSRIIEGEYQWPKSSDSFPAIIGKGLRKRFGLEVGKEFRIVLPQTSSSGAGFSPRMERFYVQAVIDLGKHEYDERIILTPLSAAQSLADLDGRFTGIRMRYKDAERAREASLQISSNLGFPYWTKDWHDVNRNLFEASKIEKVVIFFVISIMVLAAAINVCTTLFVGVLRRYADISILKTIGAKKWLLIQLFTFQGFIIGLTGTILGVLLGVILCSLFSWVQSQWSLLPGEIYRLDRVYLELRFWDLVFIFAVSLSICLVATLAPALRGARLNPVEGLRYDS